MCAVVVGVEGRVGVKGRVDVKYRVDVKSLCKWLDVDFRIQCVFSNVYVSK